MRNLDGDIGGISTLDSFGTQRALAAIQQDAGTNEDALLSEFMAAAIQGDVYQTCFFAPKVTRRVKGEAFEMHPNLGDVMADAIDYTNGPSFHDVAELLVAVSKGKDQAEVARGLLLRMATKWAEMNCTPTEPEDIVSRFYMAEGL